MVLGVEQIHDNAFIHRDLKELNMFLTSKGAPEGKYILKIGDFGVGKQEEVKYDA